jgi:hypothetical protein
LPALRVPVVAPLVTPLVVPVAGSRSSAIGNDTLPAALFRDSGAGLAGRFGLNKLRRIAALTEKSEACALALSCDFGKIGRPLGAEPSRTRPSSSEKGRALAVAAAGAVEPGRAVVAVPASWA